MADYLHLKGISEIGEATVSEQLSANIVEFFKWGLLNVGAFFNVTIPTSGAYGGDFSTLKLCDNSQYTLGQVWEGLRHNWVWQTGIDYAYQPIEISGVWVNGTFYSSDTTGTYAHEISYPLGYVIFDTAIPTGSTVKLEYSYNYYNIYNGNNPQFREIIFDTLRPDNDHFTSLNSGVYNILSENRVELPAVIVEVSPNRYFRPKEIGNSALWAYIDVNFHVLAETPYERNKITDIIGYQRDKTILSFDLNLMRENNDFPLNYNGVLNSGAKTYESLVLPSGDGGYFWKRITFHDVHGRAVKSNAPLYRSLVTAKIEVDILGN